jgi:sugar transferase (PEP-CTERM system associated)
VAIVETLLLASCVFVGTWARGWGPPFSLHDVVNAATYAGVGVLALASMGAYKRRPSEGFYGTALRIGVALFLMTNVAMGALLFLVPELTFGRGVLFVSSVSALASVLLVRRLFPFLDIGVGTLRRVLVLGAGERARRIAEIARYPSATYQISGFVQYGNSSTPLPTDALGTEARVIPEALDLPAFCRAERIDEIVMAVDERRRSEGVRGLDIEELLDCRLAGVRVSDVPAFIERDLVQPSWMVFNDGFMVDAGLRGFAKRGLDLVVSLVLLVISWPIMLLAALAILLESGFRGPVFYRQTRVGLHNRTFVVTKFRSMHLDAESGGAVWASEDDPRVTNVGAVLRSFRIDELPQLFSVLKGDMSCVGPRPERPEFVDDLTRQIRYYRNRHRVKPGLTGWAQLRYPYGASVDDARRKLEFDLYYCKNHNLLLDLIILVRTVEIVMVGDGAR